MATLGAAHPRVPTTDPRLWTAPLRCGLWTAGTGAGARSGQEEAAAVLADDPDDEPDPDPDDEPDPDPDDEPEDDDDPDPDPDPDDEPDSEPDPDDPDDPASEDDDEDPGPDAAAAVPGFFPVLRESLR